MMGRLTCAEEPEPPVVYPAEPPFMHPSKSIPPHFRDLPAIPPDRSQSSQLHRNYFAEPLQDRARSAFQEPSYSVSEAKEVRRTALSPSLKLPPIHPPSSTVPTAARDMPPHHADVPEGGKDKFPAYPDLSAAYDNMMVGYFMSQNTKANTYLPYKTQGMQLPTQQAYPSSSGQQICHHPNYVYPPPNQQLLQSDDPLMADPLDNPPPPLQNNNHNNFQANKAANSASRTNHHRSTKSTPVNQLTAMDITSSGCTVLDASTFHHKHSTPFGGGEVLNPPCSSTRDQPYPDLLDDLSMFVTPQYTPLMGQRAFQSGGNTTPSYQYKPDLGRFSVLPPVASDGDNLSLQSYSSTQHPFLDFASSPRYSGRSSYSSRSRNKRALSNSPLSAEGIDLNSIIRMSPTSLVAYVNGSRSSSSCVSPGSAGASGCYGHLSARTSSSSPGSGSSGARRGSIMTPVDLLDNLLVIQAMQDMESELPPEFDNLQVLPQDLAAIRTEDYLPLVSQQPSVLPPVHSHLRPPPTYDQHMAARKASLQKAPSSSTDSTGPSNSSSFESSEGTVGSSGGTDTEAARMYACRWLDCTAVFQDQDEFVSHIEKVHIDQKKGEDFVCFWKLCPRRLHPFNARYKLLVHMRIHSGDKPNKCTFAGCKKAFSRLENLKIHLRSHTGERPYSCVHPGCTKTFSNSSDRTKHQKTHHDTKPYVCQVVGCGKRYTDPSSLRKHIKKSHPEKKEPDRKKIRGGAEELDPNDLSECLVIHAIKPIALCDTSPPEPTDSGLGRSPRSSQPGSSSDHYPGLVYTGETFPGSDIAHTNCHTSPSSHHSSPRAQNDSEILSLNNSLRVPILPPLTPQNKNYSPVQKTPTFRNSSLL